MTWAAIRRFAAVALSLVLLAGCQGGGTTLDTVPVTGTVTLSGSPVVGATVTFSPKGEGGRAAFATTDANGQYTLTTVTAGDGAMVGSYGVAIAKTEQAAAANVQGGAVGEMSPEQLDAVYEAARSEIEGGPDADTGPKELLPVRYKDAATSGLTAEVKDGEDNDFDFDLTP